MSVNRVVHFIMLSVVTLLDYIRVPAIRAESPNLTWKHKFRIVIVGDYRVMLNPGFYPNPYIYDMINIGNVQIIHNLLQKAEALPTGGNNKRLKSNSTFIGVNYMLRLGNPVHLLLQGKLHILFLEPGNKLLYQLQPTVGSQVGLLHIQQLNPKSFRSF